MGHDLHAHAFFGTIEIHGLQGWLQLLFPTFLFSTYRAAIAYQNYTLVQFRSPVVGELNDELSAEMNVSPEATAPCLKVAEGILSRPIPVLILMARGS